MVQISYELKELIENNALALATVDESGKPHCIAVGFAKIVSKSQILITDNFMVKTRKNILKNPNIALAIWNRDWKEKCCGYELKGKAEYFASGKWLKMVSKIPQNREEPCKGAVLVTVSEVRKLA